MCANNSDRSAKSQVYPVIAIRICTLCPWNKNKGVNVSQFCRLESFVFATEVLWISCFRLITVLFICICRQLTACFALLVIDTQSTRLGWTIADRFLWLFFLLLLMFLDIIYNWFMGILTITGLPFINRGLQKKIRKTDSITLIVNISNPIIKNLFRLFHILTLQNQNMKHIKIKRIVSSRCKTKVV